MTNTAIAKAATRMLAEKTSEEVWRERGVAGEVTAGEHKTHLVQLWLCEGCLLGLGSECHTGGCALCWHNSPGHPVMPELVEMVEVPDVG